MQIMYKCCKCGAMYDWYDELYENAGYNELSYKQKSAMSQEERWKASGSNIRANSFMLKAFTPCDEGMEISGADGNLNGAVINLCEDCMRQLLTDIKPFQDGVNCWMEV